MKPIDIPDGRFSNFSLDGVQVLRPPPLPKLGECGSAPATSTMNYRTLKQAYIHINKS